MAVATKERESVTILHTRIFELVAKAFYTGKRRCFIEGSSWASKCLGKGTKVVMSDLSLKVVEDVVVGDTLMGVDGQPRKVLSLYRGQDELFRIKQARGISYVVSKNHILSLRATWKAVRQTVRVAGRMASGHVKQRREYIGRTNDLEVTNISLPEYLAKSKNFKRRFQGWSLDGVELPHKNVLVEPYFVGLWLGDGTSGNTNVTNSDTEVIDYLKWFAVRSDLNYSKIKCDEYGHALTKKPGRTNDLRQALRHYGIFTDKRIPQDYLNNSSKVRLELLAGLIDSDGCKTTSNTVSISQTRKELAEDIALLTRSLGFYTRFSKYLARMKRSGGSVYETIYYQVEFSGEKMGEIPLKLERKRANNKRLLRRHTSSFEVEPVGYGDYYGFELDGDHLFLLEDFTVTHNTYSTMQFLKELLTYSERPLICTVSSESLPHLKRGAIRDFLAIIQLAGEFQESCWNRSDFIYMFPKSKSVLEFVSADSGAKFTGARRDILFCNELNHISQSAYRQADMRTRLFTIADWNPESEFWFHEEHLADLPENEFIHAVYQDAIEVVPETFVRDMEVYKLTDPNYYRVYALGLPGELTGLVYPSFEQVDELPDGLRFYGLDYGSLVDPCALVRNVIVGDKLYSRELFYEYGVDDVSRIDKLIDAAGVKPGEPIYPDPDEPLVSNELASKYHWNMQESVKGPGSVDFGIKKVNSYFQFWTKDSVNCIKEQRNYRYLETADERNEKQRPSKSVPTSHKWSHGMDARRYGVASHRVRVGGAQSRTTISERREGLIRSILSRR